MTIIQTVLIFVGIPVAVIAVVTGAVYAGSARRGRRYRPGRPFEFTPVWFLSTLQTQSAQPMGRASLDAARREALPPGAVPAGQAQWPADGPGDRGVTGGASDRW